MSIDLEARRKLRDTITALSAKTTSRGCTEAEALTAAEKVAELLSKHGLTSADDLEFETLHVDIGARTVIDALWADVARFCHCKCWFYGDARSYDFVYFGRWNDVLVAEYLHEFLEHHIDEAVKVFKSTDGYKRRRSTKTRKEAVKSYKQGLVDGLGSKLWDLQWRRVPHINGTTAEHRALVLSPLAPVEEALKRMNMNFGDPLKPVKGADKRFDLERNQGALDSRNIEIHAGVGASKPQVAGLLK